jgi:hypothetical protein
MNNKLLTAALGVLGQFMRHQPYDLQDVALLRRHALPGEAGLATNELCCVILQREKGKEQGQSYPESREGVEMTEEQTKNHDDETHVLLAAISILLQLNNRRQPCQQDIEFLKQFTQQTHTATKLHDVASKMIRLESTIAVRRRRKVPTAVFKGL